MKDCQFGVSPVNYSDSDVLQNEGGQHPGFGEDPISGLSCCVSGRYPLNLVRDCQFGVSPVNYSDSEPVIMVIWI